MNAHDVVGPAATSPRTSDGVPGGRSRGLFFCSATVGRDGATSTATCAPASSSSSAAARRLRPRGRPAVRPTDVILAQQNVDVTVTLNSVAYNAATGVFSFNIAVTNLMNQAMGTTDGTDPAGNQIEIFFYTMPAVVSGAGTVTVTNPTGYGTFTAANQPYYQYTAPLSPGATTAAENWQLTLTGSVTGFTFAVAVDAALPAEGSIRRWTTLLGPGVTNDSLTSVFARSSSDVYAVGVNGAVLEYNGSTWSIPTTQTTSYYGVSGISGAQSSVIDVWAVGAGGAALQDTAGTWSTYTSSTTGTSNNLYGIWVAPSGTLFAVGASSTLLLDRGGTWSTMSAPATGVTMNAVWGADTADVWAVGASGTIWYYNGTSWAAQTSGTSAALYGVWGTSSTNVYAVGSSGVIKHYNGSSWSSMTSNTTAALLGVGGSSASNVWAVGATGTTQLYNGSKWMPVGPQTGIPLSAVSAGSGTPWAVGAEGSLLSYSASASAWQLSSQSGLSLNAVWASSASDVWVATLSTLLHYNGSSWSTTAMSAADSLRAVWGSGPGDTLYTGGSSGITFYRAGGIWSSVTTQAVYAVWGTAPGNVYAARVSGTIGGKASGAVMLFTSGTSYADEVVTTTSPIPNMTGVWGSSASNVFLTASTGTIYNGSGSVWSAMSVPSGTPALSGISGSSGSDVYAVGASGTILHYAGSGTWSSMTSGTSVQLYGIWADSPPANYTADAYAVGANGTVQHYNGALWLNMPTPSGTSNLRAVYGTSAVNVYVVGDLNLVLQGTP